MIITYDVTLSFFYPAELFDFNLPCTFQKPSSKSFSSILNNNVKTHIWLGLSLRMGITMCSWNYNRKNEFISIHPASFLCHISKYSRLKFLFHHVSIRLAKTLFSSISSKILNSLWAEKIQEEERYSSNRKKALLLPTAVWSLFRVLSGKICVTVCWIQRKIWSPNHTLYKSQLHTRKTLLAKVSELKMIFLPLPVTFLKFVKKKKKKSYNS